MRFLKIFGIGFLLFAALSIGLYYTAGDASERDGVGFLIVFGVIFYLPALFIVALAIQFSGGRNK
jgi:drug/metabolite transporter (DMT)-like permease